jgi:hypothetical protein
MNAFKPTPGRVLALVASAAALAAVAYGLYLAGSPAKERARRLDAQRLGHLEQIASAVDAYYSKYAKVPASLDEIDGSGPNQVASAAGALEDPETRQRYEYRVTSPSSYELCAAFALPSEDPANPAGGYPPYYAQSWKHAAGRFCFPVDAAARAKPLTAPAQPADAGLEIRVK